jgi:hypothetical protein
MRKNKLFPLMALVLLMLAFSMDALAWFPSRHTPPPPPGTGTVGVPLDGGLLTILGMAGVAYFVIRKKKK